MPRHQGVFTLTGNITNAGLIEVPMGITLREIIYDIGGGIPNGRRFKMAQTGVPPRRGVCPRLLDVPMDIDFQLPPAPLWDPVRCSSWMTPTASLMGLSSCGFSGMAAVKSFCREATQRLYELVGRIVALKQPQRMWSQSSA